MYANEEIEQRCERIVPYMWGRCAVENEMKKKTDVHIYEFYKT